MEIKQQSPQRSWQHLDSLAQAVDRGELLAFFSTRAPLIELPVQWTDGSPVVKITVPQGMFLAREGFLPALGYASQTDFFQDALRNNLTPINLPLALACGPYRQRSAEAVYLTAANPQENYTVIANAATEIPLLRNALTTLFPNAPILSSNTTPRLMTFTLIPPNLRERYESSDPLKKRLIRELIAGTIGACLVIGILMLLGAPRWLSIFPPVIPLFLFYRAQARLRMEGMDGVITKDFRDSKTSFPESKS